MQDLVRALPLKRDRSIPLEADFTEETAGEYRKQLYDFRDVDIAIVEAIFLFKREQRHHFDFAIWIDCSFETALERALARQQEGLGRDETIRAYRELYFPAEAIHIERDDPMRSADFVLINDPKLQAGHDT